MALDVYPYTEVSRRLAENQVQIDRLAAAIGAEKSRLPRNMPWLAEAEASHQALINANEALEWVLTLAGKG